MRPLISSKEDGSSDIYRGRARAHLLGDTPAMADFNWRQRLSEALEASGKSKRAVSLASGNGPGYVHSILKEGKEPTVENLLDVCAAIPVSPVHIIFGLEIAPGDEAILKALAGNPRQREGILALLDPKAP